MNEKDNKKEWERYCLNELEKVMPILVSLGFSIEKNQPHIGGERYLMTGRRDVGGGGKKLVLIGKNNRDDSRVIIKLSSDKEGIKEIEQERKSRQILGEIDFAYRTFFMPEEVLYKKEGRYLLFITKYVEQDRTFISRDLDEQFFLALRAFETQEGVHATTYSHAEVIKKAFGNVDAEDYFKFFLLFINNVKKDNPNKKIIGIMEKGLTFLKDHKHVIDRYCGFLTHSDFVPNNMRVKDNNVFLLDHASIYFGNKYESWARFINFMVHHNSALEKALVNYIRNNREKDEYLSLRLMRVYKIGFLLQFYSKSLKLASGNSKKITLLRLDFWSYVMDRTINDEEIERKVVINFTKKEDSLRSVDEIKRQKEMLGGKRLI